MLIYYIIRFSPFFICCTLLMHLVVYKKFLCLCKVLLIINYYYLINKIRRARLENEVNNGLIMEIHTNAKVGGYLLW